MSEDKDIDIDLISSLLHKGESKLLEETLSSFHPVDVASLMNELPLDDIKEIFYLLSPKISSEIIMDLNEEAVEAILEDMESKRVSEIVDYLASDDAADLLGTLSKREANEVLELISAEDTKQIRDLMQFEEDTAGGIMQAEIVTVNVDARVHEAISMLRGIKDSMDDVHNIFVIDQDQRLVGVLPVRRLVLVEPDTPITEIMDHEFVSSHFAQDQEEVARIFKKYDLISLPVVDDDGRLLGRITVDDVVDVMEEEASEDIFKMIGAGADDIIPMSIMKSAKSRLPWLFASCVGGIVALKIIGGFENTLGQFVSLASFMPVILGMGGNVGTQSTTIIVRGLALGSVEPRMIWKLIFKEVRVGFMLGVFYSLLLAAAAQIIYPDTLHLSLIVGLSMCIAMTVAATMGTMMPILLHKMGADPAVATGPFVTTSIDIIGILIFFNIATFILM